MANSCFGVKQKIRAVIFARTMPLLEVKDFTVQFQGQEQAIVQPLSFTMEAGECLGIVGESGSGKSVSCLALMGLLPRDKAIVSGSAILQLRHQESIQLIGLKSSDFQKIRGQELAMIFQEPMTALNPTMRCGAQVAEVPALQSFSKKERKQQVIQLFEEVKLPDLERIYRSYPHELSGGQRQRVMIAMALAGNPALLIADEPTTALDASVQADIVHLLNDLRQQRGMALIFISHDLNLVRHLANKVMVMYKGRCVEYEDSGKIFSSPAHPYTRALLQCRPAVGQRYERLPVLSDFFRVNADGSFEDLGSPDFKIADIQSKEIQDSVPVLQVDGLNIWYGKAVEPVVRSVSFRLGKGETLALVGESGSGKTSIGRSLVYLIRRFTGNIMLNGEALDLRSPQGLKRLRNEVQIIFQDPYGSLNPKMKIGDAIAEVLYARGEKSNGLESDAIALLEQVGLDRSALQRFPHEFSGGQRQRICIARCLAAKPRIIICDESVSALDISVQAQVLNLLKQLQHDLQLSYLFITHDMGVVQQLAHHVAVLKNGNLLEFGTVAEVFENPQSDYTRKLLEAVF